MGGKSGVHETMTPGLALNSLQKVTAFLYNKPDDSRGRANRLLPIFVGSKSLNRIDGKEYEYEIPGRLRGFWAEDVLIHAGVGDSSLKKASGNIQALIRELQKSGWQISDTPEPGALVVYPDAPTRSSLSSTGFVGSDPNKRIYVRGHSVVEFDLRSKEDLSKLSHRDREFFTNRARYMIPPKT